MKNKNKKKVKKNIYLLLFFLLISILFIFFIKNKKPYTKPEASNSLIIGGSDTDYKEYSFFSLIISEKDNKNYNMCGGALISNEWIITAAHCILNKNNKVISNEKIIILLGVQKIEANNKNLSFNVEKIIKPKNIFINNPIKVNYLIFSKLLINDIALIKIEKINEYKPILINKYNNEFLLGRFAIGLGFGDTKKGFLFLYVPEKLQKTTLRLKENNHLIFNDKKYSQYKDSFFQIFYKDTNSIFSDGDSGSPVFINLFKTNNLVGIVSSCRNDDSSCLITNVIYYYDWINNIIKNN